MAKREPLYQEMLDLGIRLRDISGRTGWATTTVQKQLSGVNPLKVTVRRAVEEAIADKRRELEARASGGIVMARAMHEMMPPRLSRPDAPSDDAEMASEQMQSVRHEVHRLSSQIGDVCERLESCLTQMGEGVTPRSAEGSEPDLRGLAWELAQSLASELHRRIEDLSHRHESRLEAMIERLDRSTERIDALAKAVSEHLHSAAGSKQLAADEKAGDEMGSGGRGPEAGTE